MAAGLPNSLKYKKGLQKPLQFGKDGKFRILHLTDIHEVDPEMDDDEDRRVPIAKSKETLNVIEKCVEMTKPDLVVFGGDNISGYWEEFTYEYMVKAIKRITEPIVKRNIPLAIVFGNHDSEAENLFPFLRHENQVAIYSEYDNFRGTMNDEDVTGCGNYNLPLLTSDGKRVAWNIWCIDSNDYLRDENYNRLDLGYGYVHDDQIKWYEKKAAELKAANDGKVVPSILFQHIPVNQELDYVEDAEEGEDGAFAHDGRYLRAKSGALSDGEMCEWPCPPRNHREQFASWKKTGDIVAAFFGHDHKNTFTIDVDGIKLIQTVSAGYHTYGNQRGGRLIILDEDKTDSFETETIMIDRITDVKL
jgi:3',5'-cyclic AMP phosphodiesterase CpdA